MNLTFRRLVDAIDPVSPAFFNQVSQYAHFFAAAAVYLTIGKFSVDWALYLLPVGLALAAWKEFWYDPRMENAATRGSDWEDFLFYCLGMGYAMAVLYI